MSVLSEKLSYFVEQRGRNMAELAKRCGIERSTLYQYLRGRRPLQNRGQLEAVMSELHLTPDERAEVWEAYEITRIGVRNYNRRCKVREILDSLLTVEEGALPRQPAEPEEAPGEPAGPGLLRGELEVNRVVNQVVRKAAAQGETLKLLAQPDYSLLMESLLLAEGPAQARVIHIICLEADSGQDGCRNLENVRRILRYGVGIRRYEPRYYYGKAMEHYGVMNVMPYLIVTPHCAIQIASDRKAAIFHEDREVVAYLGEAFDKMYQQSRPLMTSMDGFGGRQAQWAMEYVKSIDFSRAIEMCSGLCSIQFWDEGLIRKYMNPQAPGYASMIEEYIAYTAALYQAKKQGQVTVLMNGAVVEAFLQTGVFREYPAVFFAKPVSPADRRELIRRILQAVEEGWYHIRMVPAEEFSLGYRWEVLIHQGKNLMLQYSSQNYFRVFQFEETDILDAMYDFLESLSVKETVLDDSQSAALLRQWVEKYLA